MDKYKWNYPTTMWVGKNSIYDLGLACKNLNITKPLLVTDTNFSKSENLKSCCSFIFDENCLKFLWLNSVFFKLIFL